MNTKDKTNTNSQPYPIPKILAWINLTIIAGLLIGWIVLLVTGCRLSTGQEYQLAIVVSTLTIAALFNPIRNHIQSSVDHRFYRSK